MAAIPRAGGEAGGVSDRTVSNVHRLPVQPRQIPIVEPFQPFFASQMEGRQPKPRQWLIDGVLLRGTVSLLAGAPKIGKSLLLQQLLTAAALGEPWLDRQSQHVRAFGLFCEDAQDEIERRQADINAYYQRAPADIELNLSWEAREARECLLVEFERFSDKPHFTVLWDQIWNHVREHGIQLVGLDTAATTFGGNENFRGQVTPFMRALVRMAVEMDGAIVLNVHPNKSSPNSYSGTTGWLASSRLGMSLSRPPDYDPDTDAPRDARLLRNLGSNFPGGLSVERLRFDHGVLVPAEAPDPPKRRAPLSHVERQDLQYRLLIGLKRVRDNGGMVPADEMASLSMPARARKSLDPQLNRIALNDLYQAQQDLIESGRVIRVEVGRRCMLRSADGRPYDAERPWVSS